MATEYQTHAMKYILRLSEIGFCGTDTPVNKAHTLFMQCIIVL